MRSLEKEEVMKLLALIGSPRKGGNTDLLVEEIIRGSSLPEEETSKVYLYDLNFSSCVDCRTCVKEPHECALKDDLQQVYPLLEKAQVIIFGTPLYWFAPTGPMKALIDRLRPFYYSRRLEGKGALLIMPSAEGEKACTYAKGMFELTFSYLGLRPLGFLFPMAYEKGEVARKPETLRAARELGRALFL